MLVCTCIYIHMLVYSVSTFEQLLTRNNSVTTQERNLQLLMTEIFKTKSQLSTDFLMVMYSSTGGYRISFNKDLTFLNVPITTAYGIEMARFIGNKLWQILSSSSKTFLILEVFKKYIRSWEANSCCYRV